VKRALRSPILWGVLAATLVAAPHVPLYRFVASDLLQLGIIEGTIERPGVAPLNLFTFSDGSAELNRAAIASGEFPWFTDPGWKMDFFRPLASLSTAVCHALFGRDPFGYALVGLLWYLALVASLAALARQALGREDDGSGPIACLSAVLFAFATRNVATFLYNAARWVLVASTFGLVAVLAHLRWRRNGWTPGRWLAPLALCLSLLGGESGLVFAGFILAWELVAPEEPRERVRAALPTVLVVALYLGFYVANGYGTAGQDAYLNPADAPWAFLVAAPLRAFSVVSEMVFGAVSLFSLSSLGLSALLQSAIGVGALAVLALLVVPVARGASRDRRRVTLWLALGTAGSLVPALASVPGYRAAIVPFLGGSVLLAIGLHGAWRRWRTRRNAFAWLTALVALALGVIHLGYSPYLWLASVGPTRAYLEAEEASPQTSGLEEIEAGDTAVFLDGGWFIQTYYEYNERRIHDQVIPAAWRQLSASSGEHRYTRPDERTLDLELPDGGMFRDEFLYAFRTRRRPLATGDTVELPGLLIEILASGPDGPTRLRYRFEHPLEDPRYRFYRWQKGAFVAEEPPAIGSRLTLP